MFREKQFLCFCVMYWNMIQCVRDLRLTLQLCAVGDGKQSPTLTKYRLSDHRLTIRRRMKY